MQDSEAPTSAQDAVASGGASETEDGSLRDHRAPQDQDGGSPQSIYDEYALHRRFFQEARDGLIRFSGRLKQGEGDGVNEQLTHNDLAGLLLYAQMGLDKAEEYKETLTAPLLGSAFSPDEARSMLAELRKIQGEVLTSLGTFWDRLEAEEGHAQFKDEFARWYTESLEPLTSAEPNRNQRRSAPDLSEPPRQGQQGPTGSPEGVTPSELANRLINWFRDLPSVPKLIIVGVLLLLLLTVLSPVARVVAFGVFMVSAVVLVIRAVQRKPLRGWVIVVVGSLVLIPIFGGVSGAIYGNGFRESGEIAGSADDGQFFDSLSETETQYIERTISIADETAVLVNRQIALNDQCGGSCFVSETAMQETEENVQRMNELAEEASQLTPPTTDYADSYEAFLNSWDKRSELLNYLRIGTLQGDAYLNSLQLDGNNYQNQAVELAPPEAQNLYQPLHQYR